MTRAQSLPRAIWLLGFVSLFMDVSSEMIHSLLPVFMVSGLGASAFAVGLVEGIAEATALVVRVFSGAISDYLGRRKALAVIGYGLGALSKPLFALATSVNGVLVARFTDRIGKGIRGAPRDAMVADLAPPEMRGAAFGLRQSLDTVGAFLGPLLAIGLMLLYAGDFRSVFWIAAIPAAIAVLLLVFGVEEVSAPGPAPARAAPIDWRALRDLPRAYWLVALAGGVFTLARFSEAFLVLRAQEQGLPDALAPLVFVLMNLVFAACAYPAGRFADRLGGRALLGAGLAALICADLVLAFAPGLSGVALGVAAWGLHMALTQGVLAAMVAATAPAPLRGTAFGIFGLVCGVAMLAASALAGLLWDVLGSAATFIAGAGFALVALGLLVRVSGRA